MLTAVVLTLAAAVPLPDVYEKDGCRWIRPAQVATVPARTHIVGTKQRAVTAAPGNRRPSGVDADTVGSQRYAPSKAKPRRVAKPQPAHPADELIGCDEDGPVWTSDIASIEFWPETVPPVTARLEPPIPEQTSSETACDCATSGPGSPWSPPGYTGGPIYLPPVILAPVPEPSTWLLLLGGMGIIIRRIKA